MLKILWLLVFLLTGICVILSCNKDAGFTTIKGRILDVKTGMPIKDVGIEFGIKKEINGLDQSFIQTTSPTDANGEFVCVLESEYYAIFISKNGYVDKYPHLDIIPGQINNVEISLIPIDGSLKLKIKNATGLHDTIYTSIFSRVVVNEARWNTYDITKEFPLLLYKDEEYDQLFSLPSPEVVQSLSFAQIINNVMLSLVFFRSIPLIAG